MHNSSDATTGLSDLMHSLLFVKLNAFEGFGGGAFTLSIDVLIFSLFFWWWWVDKFEVIVYNIVKPVLLNGFQ